MKNFPTLYKKTNTDAIQFWEISVEDTHVERPIGTMLAGTIVTKYGQVGTDSPQETRDLIVHGKNTGKKNGTTANEQAYLEAQAKWEKQKKKGYVETKEGAQNDELDALIEGGVEPMLAESYMDVVYDMRPGHENGEPQLVKTKESKKIKFPVLVQPKLDGIRCIAIVKDGECTLWSRTRKPITSCPHIVQELEAAFETMDIILDGELYNHDMKDNFEKIVSLVRQEEPGEGYENIQYHVYDTINEEPFKHRFAKLTRLFRMYEFYGIKMVQTDVAKTEEEGMALFVKHRKAQYEGAMFRNVDSLYVNKRSMDLQKFKEFNDDEFVIVGIEEGRGKLAGHVGSFICVTKEDKKFLAKLKGDTAQLKLYFENESMWKGKQLTVRYQGYTKKENVPRFPVGLAVRDYE